MIRIVAVLLSCLCFSLFAGGDVSADEAVRYRLETWKRKHIHDNAKADRIADTLRKLGCEVEKAPHNGHVDVKYRCVEWRQLKPLTAEEAAKWEKWFKEFHFQTEYKPSQSPAL